MTDLISVTATLNRGGRALWDAITAEHDLDPAQQVQLIEACRAKDRLDQLDELLRGDVSTWARLTYKLHSEDKYELVVDAALSQANNTANLLKQLLAALRLPDAATGKRPGYHGPRGVQKPTVAGGKPAPVTALERLRAASAS